MICPFTHAQDSLSRALIYLLVSEMTIILPYLPLHRQIDSLRLPHQTARGEGLLPPSPPDPILGPLFQLLLQAVLLCISLFRSCLRRVRPLPVPFIQDPPSSLSVRCAQTSRANHEFQLTGRHHRLSPLFKVHGPNTHEILALQTAFPPRTRA
jgi:hypothetical protein